ncbi:30S ribosomal protein 3-1, chloroplastic-like [Pistacia vera]|uniref:30S ribosomal protein 3-1, chloroplastic n=1 Tax=Pistacia vera TaxID=55513 RepID=UPI00126373D1|nr:30S ribosomal protein 3-1, chloroplastic [Pistacia vera]XP_031262894.1 30S ribosomal protein 3-1, chloroplastic-like [Pistacia vera]
MFSSMALQSSFNTTLTSCSSFPSHKLSLKSFKTSIHIKSNPISRNQRRLSTTLAAAPETLTAETSTDTISSTPVEIEKAEVSVKQVGKPRLVLKFIWMEKNIGLALDQSIPGHGTIPLSPYFFWPRKDAWEELKATLESKPWISQKKMILLLNQATDIINLWQQSGGNLTT